MRVNGAAGRIQNATEQRTRMGTVYYGADSTFQVIYIFICLFILLLRNTRINRSDITDSGMSLNHASSEDE
jgi:hypothetical protein